MTFPRATMWRKVWFLVSGIVIFSFSIAGIGLAIGLNRWTDTVLTQSNSEARAIINSMIDNYIAIQEATVYSLSSRSEVVRLIEEAPGNYHSPFIMSSMQTMVDSRARFFMLDGREIRGISPRLTGNTFPIDDTLITSALAYEYSTVLESSSEGLRILSAAPVVDEDFMIKGAVVLYSLIDQRLLDQMKALSNVESAVLCKDHISASTILQETREQWLPEATREHHERGPFVTMNLSGEPYSLSFSPLLDLEQRPVATLVIAMPLTLFHRAISTGIVGILAIATFSIILGLIPAFLFSRRLTTPIRRLTECAGRIGSLHFEPLEIPGTGDEIDTLTREFNRLQVALEGSIRRAIRNENLAALGRFSTEVMHDIKNPIEAMKLLVVGLKRKLDPESPAIPHAEELEQSVKRLEDLTSRTLDLMRIGRPDRKSLSLAHVVRDSIETIHIKQKIRFTASSETCRVSVDPEHIRRILENLLSNAGQASGEEDLISVTLHDEEDSVQLIVEDCGSGVPEVDRERIFDPFFTTRSTGHGLGLSIALQLAHVNGFELLYEPRLPHGSRFILSLVDPGRKVKP